MTISVSFLDAGRDPQCKSNPKFPDGIDLDLRPPEKRTPLHRSCSYNLPYPAPRCGTYVVVCDSCGFRAAITVAGRPDDPRTVTLPCKGN